LWAGELRGVVIHDLLPTKTTARLVARLEVNQSLPRFPLGGQFAGETLGLGLDRALGEHHQQYFPMAEQLQQQLNTLSGKLSLDQLLEMVLIRMAAPVPLHRARDPRHGSFAPLVFRRLPKSGRIPPHAELEQLDRAPYQTFGQTLSHQTLLSFFLCLQPPTAGGALRVYDLNWADYDRRQDWKGHTNPAPQLSGVSWTEPEIRAGSLVVFDGGRWFHEVTPV